MGHLDSSGSRDRSVESARIAQPGAHLTQDRLHTSTAQVAITLANVSSGENISINILLVCINGLSVTFLVAVVPQGICRALPCLSIITGQSASLEAVMLSLMSISSKHDRLQQEQINRSKCQKIVLSHPDTWFCWLILSSHIVRDRTFVYFSRMVTP